MDFRGLGGPGKRHGADPWAGKGGGTMNPEKRKEMRSQGVGYAMLGFVTACGSVVLGFLIAVPGLSHVIGALGVAGAVPLMIKGVKLIDRAASSR